MSINHEEKFIFEQNQKIYSIIISIQEDQLSLVLINSTIQPKKYSGYFSLIELRIFSPIFQHTQTLLEAKEIIKRTIIKKQILIVEDDFRAKIIFDTGLGYDSVPFPITLFFDSDIKNQNMSYIKNNKDIKNPQDNLNRPLINGITPIPDKNPAPSAIQEQTKENSNNFRKLDNNNSEKLQVDKIINVINKFIDKGYLPVFMKLDNYKPLFFFIKKESKLETLFIAYLHYCPEINEGIEKDIKLYNKGRLLDMNKPLVDLNLKPLAIITNNMEQQY